MELLKINTHFFPYFIINGVTALLWQLQLTMQVGNPYRVRMGEASDIYYLNNTISTLESSHFPEALFESCCRCSIFTHVAKNSALSIMNLFCNELRHDCCSF